MKRFRHTCFRLCMLFVVLNISTLAAMKFLSIGAQRTQPPDSSVGSWKPIEFSPVDLSDLPDVYVGTEAQFRVNLVNTSDEPLTIQQLSTTCGCAHVRIDVKTIPLKSIATLTGIIRPVSRPKNVSAMVEFQVIGSESGKHTLLKYPIVANFVYSVVIESKIAEITSDGESIISHAGDISIQNVSPKKIVVKVASYQSDNVRLTPREFMLDPASLQSIGVEVEGSEESNGFARISIDGDREVHMVPLKVRMAGRIKAVPKVLVLGGVTVKGGCTKSTFPARVTIRGEKLKDNTVIVESLPTMFENVKLSIISPTEVNLEFDLAARIRNSKLRGLIRLQLVSSSKDVVQTLEIPVVGFHKL